MRKTILLTALMTLICLPCAFGAWQDAPQQQNPPQNNQAPPPPDGQGREKRDPQDRTFGTITSVGVDRFEVKKMDGAAQTVMVNAQTRYREGEKDIQLEDLKIGDCVMIGGQRGQNNAVVATAVNRVTDEQVQRMQQMQGHRAFGQIVSISGNEIKVQSRQGERTVVVNEQTTYTKDGQTITVKDLKVGDRIMASGDEANGQFTATRVMTGEFRRGEGRGQGRRNNDNPNP